MAGEKTFTDWIKQHEKQDRADFDAIHTHLDRLDKATNTDLIVYKIDELKSQFQDLEKKLDGNYVTKEQFAPVQRIAYGLVTIILTGVVGAVLAIVLRK